MKKHGQHNNEESNEPIMNDLPEETNVNEEQQIPSEESDISPEESYLSEESFDPDENIPVIEPEQEIIPEEEPEEEYPEPEPVPMELGAHAIDDIIDDSDPDTPLFRETSTKKSDSSVTSKGKKMTWKPLMFLIAMAIIAVIIVVWSVISLGNLNERLASPLTVGNQDVSNAEFSLMYHYVLLENGVDIFKENTEEMLSQPGENGFPTYRDYFLDITAKEIQTVYMLYDDAVAHGYSITQDHRDRAQAYVDWLKTKADALHVDLNTYIKGTFGEYVTKDLILQVLPKVYFTEDYAANQKLEELKATPEQAEQAYQDSRNSYDLISYRVIRITLEAREEQYVTTANIHAQQIIEETNHDESQFQIVAANHFSGEMKEKLLIPDSTLQSNVRYSEISDVSWRAWLFDPERTSGDCTIFNDEYGFPIIFCFVNRVRQEEPLRNVRFFYINIADEELGTPGVSPADFFPLSQTIFDSISDEASMITLETTYADELFEGAMRVVQQTSIYPGNNPEKIDEWIFDPARQSGDKIMFEEDSYNLIMFYVGASPNPEWYDRVNSFIRMDNYQAFVTEKLKDYAYTFHDDGLEYIQDIPS